MEIDFVRGSDGWPSYGTVVTARSYSGGGGTFQLYNGYGSGYGGNNLRYRTADYSANSSSPPWTSFRTIWDSGNDGSGSGLDADILDGMQPAGLFSTSHVQTAQLQLRAHTNSWNGGIKFISNDGNNESQLHMDNSSSYDLMVDSSFYVGGTFRVNGDAIPHTDGARDLGTSSLRLRNIYTTDLQLSNEGKTNDVDGTWGNYTIQEGESDLFLINNRNGKKYKFNLTEVN